MTLCVAFGDSASISLLSDSRITIGDDRGDLGFKILPIPLRIYGARDSGTGEISVVHYSMYGMGFSGSVTGLNTVKDFLNIVLQSRVQFVPTNATLSFFSICQWLEDFYKSVANELKSKYDGMADIDFFFAGLCPETKRLGLALYTTGEDLTPNSFRPRCEIIDVSRRFARSIGSGSREFDEMIKGACVPNDLTLINNVRTIISRQNIRSVGGNIQYGTFDGSGDFEVKGIAISDEDGTKTYLGGIEIGRLFDHENHGIFVTGRFLGPFPPP